MQVFVKSLNGGTETLTVERTDSIESVRAKLQATGNFPSDFQLVYAGKQMDNKHRLEDYNINPNSTFYAVARLRGG